MLSNCRIMRFIIPVLMLVTMISGSCSGRKKQAEHKNIIPKNELVSILTDLYIADGLLSHPNIRYMYIDRDSIATYMEVIEKYGYTKELMDRTMRYYFIKRPKKLVRIYDQVLGNLSEMESRYFNEASEIQFMKQNLWTGKKNYYLPDPALEDSLWFDFPVKNTGYYTLKFSLTIYPDDQSSNPRCGLFIYYPEEPDTLNRDYFNSLSFIKDGQNHNYNLYKIIRGYGQGRLRGWFIDYENQHPDIRKHMKIENIHFSRSRPE
jgi:hypothetical protein